LLTSSSAASITFSNFDDACPILYSQADDFIKQCIEKARPLTWVFNGRKSAQSVFFQQVKSASHFQLGCTIDSNGAIGNVGIYYAIDPAEFSLANIAPLYSIEDNGDVELNVDDRVGLLFIRQFVTRRVRPARYYDHQIKNCEASPDKNGVSSDNHGDFQATIKRFSGGALVTESGNFPLGTFCGAGLDNRYVSVPDSSNMHIVAANFACQYFVMADGSLLIAQKSYNDFCVTHDKARGFLARACSVKKN
jgi:hypothetical protein